MSQHDVISLDCYYLSIRIDYRYILIDMADDNKSYRLNLDKGKGHQIELLDRTETMTIDSTKSKKSTGTRQTIKLKNRSDDKDANKNKNKSVKDKHEALARPKEWDQEINRSEMLRDIDLVGNEETKQHVAVILEKQEDRKNKAQTQTPPPSEEETVFDLAPPPKTKPVPSVIPGLASASADAGAKGIGSISREINAINRKLDSIPEEIDVDVRTESSTKMMNFAPSLPKKQPIDNYSRVDLTGGVDATLTPKRQLYGRELHAAITSELLKIERLKKRGYQPSRMFTIVDKLEHVQAERARLEEIASLESSVQMQKNGLRFASSILEMANTHYNNLFDLNLNGWSDSLNDNIDSYEPVFEELHEKYKDSVQMAPELKLIMMFIGSAVSFHFTQQVLKKAEKEIPGIGMMMERNPRLKKEVTNTAAKMFAQNMTQKNGNSGGGGASDLLGGLFGGGGNVLSGLFGGNSQPAPVVVGTRANNVQLREPDDLDNLLGNDFNQGMLSEATVRIDDDLTSHITGSGPKNVQFGNTKRTVKRGAH